MFLTESPRTGLKFLKISTILVCLIVCMSGTAWSQVYTGSLTGVVKDPSGAVVPGAEVTLTDVGKNTNFTRAHRRGRPICYPSASSQHIQAQGGNDWFQRLQSRTTSCWP